MAHGPERQVKILVLDIETRPNMAYVWGLWDQNIGLNQIIETGTVISFAAKWYGKKKVHFYSDYHDGHDNMIKAAWNMINDADAVVHFNGKAFDIKHLNREFVLGGLHPPSPHKDIDLLSIVKQRFKFASNKLQHVSQELGIGSKLQHDGFDLWVRCMANDDKAWNMMRRYNRQDVVLTEEVYERLRPWIKNHPNVNIGTSRPDACPTCGSDHLQARGTASTNIAIYQRWQCQACGGWFRSKDRLLDETSHMRNVS